MQQRPCQHLDDPLRRPPILQRRLLAGRTVAVQDRPDGGRDRLGLEGVEAGEAFPRRLEAEEDDQALGRADVIGEDDGRRLRYASR